MKVLILDDNTQKVESIKQALSDCGLDAEIVFAMASCVISGIRMLREDVYDLLLLDLLIPTRNGTLPSAEGGKAVLDEIIDGQLKIPSHIVCLTAFEEESKILDDDVRKALVHLVIYDELSDGWKVKLQAKAKVIAKRLEQSRTFPPCFKTDIVILTSSPLVELNEVKNLPGGFIAEYSHQDQLHYYHADWDCVAGSKISVVACAAPSMGMTAACVTACKAIERWRPRFLVMTGIAASTVKENSHGDVLCVETAYDYGSGKIAEDDDGLRKFIPSPQQLHLEPKIQSIVKHWERDQIGMREIQSSWYSTERKTPTLVVGVMASGAAVVQSEEMVEEIKSNSRKTVGLDMEAYAVFQACALASVPRPIAFVAKGVSDHANKEKSDQGQRYAAFASAQFVYRLFTSCSEMWH